MPNALLRLGQCLLAVAMFAICGGHWMVMQSVAWGRMVVDYARTERLTVAVEKTLDGEHPCGMCKAIEKQKSSEKKEPARADASKVQLFYAAAPARIPLVRASWTQGAADVFAEACGKSPAVPPPRLG